MSDVVTVDHGLQAERTVLAWRRTAATGAAGSALALHHVLTTPHLHTSDLAIVAATVAGTVLLAGLGRLRERELGARPPTASRHTRALSATAALVALVVGASLFHG